MALGYLRGGHNGDSSSAPGSEWIGRIDASTSISTASGYLKWTPSVMIVVSQHIITICP